MDKKTWLHKLLRLFYQSRKPAFRARRASVALRHVSRRLEKEFGGSKDK